MAYDPIADLQKFIAIIQTPSPLIPETVLSERGVSARVPRSLADLLDQKNNENLFKIGEFHELDSLEQQLETQTHDQKTYSNLPGTIL